MTRGPDRRPGGATTTPPSSAPGRRLLSAFDCDLAEHERRLGALPGIDAGRLIAEVTDSGLAGRGGAAFPTGRKLATVAGLGRASRAVVLANGAEGEPASSKDRALLARAPHLVLDGLALAARAVGAGEAYLYAPADLLDSTVRAALRERRDAVRVRTVAAPDTFVSGQETAAVSAVNGGRALPMSPSRPVFERGVHDRPTLVQNVETLAQLALVARYGAAWFRAVGTQAEPGTRLTTVSGAVRAPDVYESAGGASLASLIEGAGGSPEPIQALLVGGYHGGWVPWTDRTADLRLTVEALRPYEAAPGAGVIVALPASRCGLRAGADIAAYLAGQSAAQCGPCRNGLPTIASLLVRLADRRAGPRDVAEIHRVVGLVDGRGACHHPGGTARLVRSTMRTFADEVREHLSGYCSAQVPAGRAMTAGGSR